MRDSLTRDGTAVAIEVENGGAGRGVVEATLDGAPLPVKAGAAVVPLVRDGQAHAVRVRLG